MQALLLPLLHTLLLPLLLMQVLLQALLLRLRHTLLLPLILMQVLLQALLLRLRHLKLRVVRQWLHVCGDDSTIDALLHTLLRNWLLVAAWDRQAMPAGLAAHVRTLDDGRACAS